MRIEIPNDIKILEKSVTTISNIANEFKINEIQNNSFKIDFDYLDPNEGGIIKLIHDGSTSINFLVRGRIKGAGEPDYINLSEGNINVAINFSYFKFSLKIRRNIIGFIFLLAPLFIILVSIFAIIFLHQNNIPWLLNLFCYSYTVFYLYQKYIKIKIPKEFSFIDKNI